MLDRGVGDQAQLHQSTRHRIGPHAIRIETCKSLDFHVLRVQDDEPIHLFFQFQTGKVQACSRRFGIQVGYQPAFVVFVRVGVRTFDHRDEHQGPAG